MTGESRAKWKHVCEITCFGIEFPMRVTSPRTAGPALVEEFPSRGRQGAREVLRAVHSVDRIFDRSGFDGQTFSRLIPCADDVFDAEWQGVSLHQRGDLLRLLFHCREQRKSLFAGEVASESIMCFLFASDFCASRQRFDVDGDV